MKITGMILCAVLGVSVVALSFSGRAMAQEKLSADIQKMDAPYVTLYKQSLDMGGIYYPKGSYTWDQIKDKLTDVLPESQTESKSAEELCDHMDLLYRLYSKDNKVEINSMAEAFEKLKPLKDGEQKGSAPHPYFNAIASRMISSSNTGFEELLKSYPESQEVRVFALRGSVQSELLVSYVHDAALLNCKEYASAKGYKPVWAPDTP